MPLGIPAPVPYAPSHTLCTPTPKRVYPAPGPLLPDAAHSAAHLAVVALSVHAVQVVRGEESPTAAIPPAVPTSAPRY